MDEQETYRLLAGNDKEGVALLYTRYGRRLYSYAIVHWQLGEDEAWELVYKTLYKVVDSHKGYTFESEKKFGSFIFRIFINYLRNHYRDQKRMDTHVQFTNFHESLLEGDQEGGLPAAERQVRDRITQNSLKADKEEETAPNPAMQLLREELEQLEDWQRVLLLLRSQDMPYSEISRHIDKPESQLKVYYQRLKEKIQKRLQGKIIAVAKN